MRETAEDLQRLQTLLDDSIDRAGPFPRRSFEMPEHSLSAGQLAGHLQGSFTLALATVTARGEPRVAPIGALFFTLGAISRVVDNQPLRSGVGDRGRFSRIIHDK